MLTFFTCLFCFMLGACFGVVLMALFIAAGDSDKCIDTFGKRVEKPKCFRPNSYAYPLCVGLRSDDGKVIAECQDCQLWEDWPADNEDD
jgi:hypothetical protein